MGEAESPERPRWGRPRNPPEEARSQRVVTFVTEDQLEALEKLAREEDRSRSAVVYRIITQHLSRSASASKSEDA